jgi:prevent-host-death family protein
MVMLMVNIAEAKAKLSELIDAATRGEQIVICNRNRPVAELRAAEPVRSQPRDLTPIYPGETFMTDAFFDPLSPAELEDWYGRASPRARVAETAPPYPGKRGSKRRS